MNREILFRGKCPYTGEWLYGDYVLIGVYPGIKIRGKEPFFPVLPNTIGQFTGLTNKNGVKIFDGDVILYSGDDLINLIVEWSNDYLGYFVGLGLGETIEQPLYDLLFPEVIGNIHDNPELLQNG